jgi:hypothetical protein
MKWIDDFSLNCLEKRYEHYLAEKGNSFVHNLMDDLRALPKKPPDYNIESDRKDFIKEH